MIPITFLLTTLTFSTPFGCVQHLDIETTNRPASAIATMRTPTNSLINLHGAFVILRCQKTTYTATLLTDQQSIISASR